MKLVWIAVAIALLLAGCGGGSDDRSAPPKVFDVKGTMTLTDPSGVIARSGECIGSDGYDDVREGAAVTIYDADGSKIALGKLGPGVNVEGEASCTFDFGVPDVPAGGKIYSIEVSHRGEIPFKRAQAKKLSLTLG